MSKAFAVLFLGLAGCNYDTGECWVRGEGEEGFGGGVIVPTGVGGYGDAPTGVGGIGPVPLQPQRVGGAPDPCKHQLVECKVTWKAGSAVCKSRGASGSCTILYQDGHASLEEAKKRCEFVYGVGISEALSCDPCWWVTGSNVDPIEQCKRLCDKINLECIARCPKGNQACMDKCNQQNGKCLKDCEK